MLGSSRLEVRLINTKTKIKHGLTEITNAIKEQTKQELNSNLLEAFTKAKRSELSMERIKTIINKVFVSYK